MTERDDEGYEIDRETLPDLPKGGSPPLPDRQQLVIPVSWLEAIARDQTERAESPDTWIRLTVRHDPGRLSVSVDTWHPFTQGEVGPL